MDMELGIGTEELLVGSCNNNKYASSHIAKGKRTKRLRPLSPCAVAASAAITSSSSSASGEHVGGDYGSFSSTTTTTTTSFEEEEEDMANCLILLAQGKRGGEGEEGNKKISQKSSSSSSNRRFSEVATTATATATAKIGFYIYECKTCNRTFPSFQALGGHRASHKKPKNNPEEKKSQSQPQPQLQLSGLPLVTNCEFEEAKQGHVITSPPISLQLGCGASNSNNNNINRGFHGGNKKPKIHECSICGSEFTSGQALGGHMRRHRASTGTSAQVVGIETSYDAATTAAPVEVKPPRNVLELDLNLPAPEDDHRDSKFQFVGTQKSMMLSAASASVGCHY